MNDTNKDTTQVWIIRSQQTLKGRSVGILNIESIHRNREIAAEKIKNLIKEADDYATAHPEDEWGMTYTWAGWGVVD